MINLDKLIADVVECIGLPYVSPGYTGTRSVWRLQYDAQGRLVKVPAVSGIDCSGLLVRAFAIQGESLYHGSNYIARHELVGNAEQLKSEKQLKVGMAVFKWSASGEPSKYAGDGQGNFHHIGLVTSVHPLTITHASSVAGKVKQDTVVGKWSHFGWLKKVDYKKTQQEAAMAKYKVIAASGETVNMRRNASTTSDVLAKVRVGSQIDGYPCGAEGWTSIVFDGVPGYMMSKFLEPIEQSATIQERIAALQKRVAALEAK